MRFHDYQQFQQKHCGGAMVQWMYQVIPCKGVKTIQEMHKMKCLLKAVYLTVTVNLVSLIEKKKELGNIDQLLTHPDM